MLLTQTSMIMLFKFDQQQILYQHPIQKNPKNNSPHPSQASTTTPMQNQYPKKIANLLRNSSSIIPTSYELYYSLLKLICNNISNQQMTPQLLDQFSKMYKIVKVRLQKLDVCYRAGLEMELQINSRQFQSQYKDQHSHQYQHDFINKNNKPNTNIPQKQQQQSQTIFLQQLIKPFLKYLPKKYIATLLSKHFFDNQFYTIITQSSIKAYETILGTNNSGLDSGSMTPLIRPSINNGNKCDFGGGDQLEFNKQLKQYEKKGGSCISSMKQEQSYNILNSVIKNRTSLTNKLHINGNNQLSIIFWLNSFKFDYAVHFDVFWVNLLKYLNTVLTPQPQPTKQQKLTQKNTKKQPLAISSTFYPIFFPFEPSSTVSSNCSLKSKIKQIVDPDNKYYVTSASCNQLFKQFNQPQFLELLIELTLSKKEVKEQKKSSKCQLISYRWRRVNQQSVNNISNSSSKCMNSSLQKRGTVLINNFSTTKQINHSPNSNNTNPKNNPIPSSVLINNSSQLPQNTQIMLTGCSIAFNTKIFQSRYPPTIRFGSLADNQVCIKNKYVSRRQFMIIQEQIQLNQQQICLNNSSRCLGFNRDRDRDRQDSSYAYDAGRIHQNNTIKIKNKDKDKNYSQSKYFIVCLSPSNHTCLIYQEDVQVQTGMIFKFQGIYVQIVKVAEQFGSNNENNCIEPNNQLKKQYNNQQKPSKNLQNSQSQIQIQDLSLSKQTINMNFNNGGLLTGVPAQKTQQNQYPQYQQQDEDPTLEYLPKQPHSTDLLFNKNSLQYMCISGEQKGRKFQLHFPNKNITMNNKIFEFVVKNNRYFIPKNTEILVKNANQVLSGHLSDKIQLKAGMKLSLEEIQFQILE